MTLNLALRRSFVPLLTGAGILCAGLLAITLHNPDAAIGNSFGRVLASDTDIVQADWQPRSENELKMNIVPAVNTVPMPAQNLLAVGDQIMLMDSGRNSSSFRILDIELFNDTVTRIDMSIGPSHKLLITAKDMSEADGRIIRFVLDIAPAPDTPPLHSSDQIL